MITTNNMLTDMHLMETANTADGVLYGAVNYVDDMGNALTRVTYSQVYRFADILSKNLDRVGFFDDTRYDGFSATRRGADIYGKYNTSFDFKIKGRNGVDLFQFKYDTPYNAAYNLVTFFKSVVDFNRSNWRV